MTTKEIYKAYDIIPFAKLDKYEYYRGALNLHYKAIPNNDLNYNGEFWIDDIVYPPYEVYKFNTKKEIDEYAYSLNITNKFRICYNYINTYNP